MGFPELHLIFGRIMEEIPVSREREMQRILGREDLDRQQRFEMIKELYNLRQWGMFGIGNQIYGLILILVS